MSVDTDADVIRAAETFVHAIGHEKVWISMTGEMLLDEQQEAQS